MNEAITPIIPQTITVHMGAPDAPAENITVPFAEYIKNVASSEIYPTWPENALRANIYAIISFALNRIYTEWYRSRGYDFDITDTTAYDQAFVKDRDIFENISAIVDDIFNDYVVRQGSVEPLFTQFCNGTTTTCAGLSQWGTVTLAQQGLTPYDILRRYYGDDIGIIENAPVAEIEESYPGVPLRVGATGNNVKIIQTQLNRIAQNYPAIPRIAYENGVFGVDTEAAVQRFQEIFGLSQTGIIDKATWYRIKQYYVGVKGLSELVSEGISIEEASVPYSAVLRLGSEGIQVRTVQYYLNVLAYFNGALTAPPLDGAYGESTVQAVWQYQRVYGLPVTGEVDIDTWVSITGIYSDIISSLPPEYTGGKAKLYPGYFLSQGMSGEDVRDLQTYLSAIAHSIPQIPQIPVTGHFGSQTRNAVAAFQRLYGIPANGAVGPVTWNAIARQYDALP